MRTISRLFILLLSTLLALSSSAMEMAAAGGRYHRLHHHGHHHHHHLTSRETVHFKPSTDTVPFPSIPWIVPGNMHINAERVKKICC